MRTRHLRATALLIALACGAAGAWAQGGVPCATTTDRLTARYDGYGSTAVHLVRAEAVAMQQPIVVLTSYLSLVDMDYDSRGPEHSAREGPEAEDEGAFVYRALAQRLACRGYSVVKYDAITLHRPAGDGPDGGTPPVPDAQELLRLERRDFSGLLGAVLAAVDERLGEQRPVILVGHSGGAFTVGDFLARQSHSPRTGPQRPMGFVGISAAVSNDPGTPQTHSQHWVRSLRRCLQTQRTAACVSELTLDPHYTLLIKDDVRAQVAGLSTTHEGEDFLKRAETLLDGFARDTLRTQKQRRPGTSHLNDRYEIRSDLFDSLQFRTPSAIPISCLALSSRLLYGDRDFIVWHEVEARAWMQACGRASDIQVMTGIGHALGQDKYFGPMAPRGLTAVTDAVDEVAQDLAPPPAGRHLMHGDGGRP